MLAALLALALLGVWELYADLSNIDAFLLPAPHEIAQSLWDDRSLLWSNLAVTFEEIALGIALAVVAALLFAVAIHLFTAARRAVLPLLIGSQTIPIVIVAPLLIAWFGFEITPKVAIVALVCFFPIVVTTIDGLASVDPDLRKLLATFDASRWAVLRHVEGPTAVPSVLSGAKVSVAVAVIGAVLAEQAGSSDGLGHLILQAIPQLETARAYAAVVVLSVLAVVLYGGLTLVERRLVSWSR
ncbi:MAG TPA: ABC transporter permease [Solirubrobacteraceae bacterium]